MAREKSSDVLARMKATASRQRPEQPAKAEQSPQPTPGVTKRATTRFTLDLTPDDRRALRRYEVDHGITASEVIRALIRLLERGEEGVAETLVDEVRRARRERLG